MVKRPTLRFSSGHDFTVREFEPRIGLCADSMEPAWDSLSGPCLLSLSLKINKLKKIFLNKKNNFLMKNEIKLVSPHFFRPTQFHSIEIKKKKT